MNTVQFIAPSLPQQDAHPVQNQNAGPSSAQQDDANSVAPPAQDARPVQRATVKPQAGKDAADNTGAENCAVVTTFDQLLGQMLGTSTVATPAPLPQQQDDDGTKTTKTQALPDAQTTAAAQQTAPPASVSLHALPRGQETEKDAQPQDAEVDRNFKDLLPGAEKGQDGPKKPVPAEADVQDHAAGTDQRADNAGKPAAFPVRPELGKQEKPEAATPNAPEKTPAESQSLSVKNAPVQAVVAITTGEQHGAQTVQAQTVHSVVSAAALPADGNLHVRPPAVDPAEAFENTVSIIRDGNRLAVKLEPDGLGKLDINLSLDQGKVHAQINVQDTATKSLIENNMQQIVDALLKDGMSVGGFSVSLRQGNNGDQATDNQAIGSEKTNALAEAVSEINGTETQGVISIFV